MIGRGTMIAMLPEDIRGRLRGHPDDDQLRELGRMFIENEGDCCPRHAFDEAVQAWLALGCPDPEPVDPTCPYCADTLTSNTITVTTSDGTEHAQAVLYCERCDNWFGPTWDTDPERRVQVHGHGHIPGMG